MAVKETRREGSKKREKGSQKGGRPREKGEPSRRGWTGHFREIGGRRQMRKEGWLLVKAGEERFGKQWSRLWLPVMEQAS